MSKSFWLLVGERQVGDPARPAAARTVPIAPKRRHSQAEVGLKQPQSVADSHRTPGDWPPNKPPIQWRLAKKVVQKS